MTTRKKRTSMHFNTEDLAEACNLSTKTIFRKGITKDTIKQLSINDLVLFVNENKVIPSDNLSWDKSNIEGYKNKNRCRLHFHKKEIADFIGVSFRRLQHLCLQQKIKLEDLTFKELVSFISKNYNNEKRKKAASSTPETTKCPD